MKKFKNTFLALFAMSVLGAYVFFVEYRGEEARNEKKQKSEQLFSIDSKDIRKFSVEFKPGTEKRANYVLESKDEQWNLVTPVAYKLDASKGSSLTSTFSTLKKEISVGTDLKELNQFGLDAPEVTIKAVDASGKEYAIAVGSDTPVGAHAYALNINTKEVVTVAKTIKSTFSVEIKDLRDKTIVEPEQGKIRMIDATVTGKSWSAANDKGAWSFSKPLAISADTNAFDSFLSGFKGLRAEDFVFDGAITSKELSKFGLTSPSAQVTLKDEAQKELGHYLFGRVQIKGKENEKDAGRYDVYAMVKGGNHIFKLPSGSWDKVGKLADELMLKKPLKFAKGDVSEIHLKPSKGDSIILKKDAALNSWALNVNGALKPGFAKEAAVNEIIDGALALEAEKGSWARSAVDTPGWTVTFFKQEGAETKQLAMIAGGPKKGKSQIASFSEPKDLIAQVDAEKIKWAQYKASQFESEPAKPEAAVPAGWKKLEPTGGKGSIKKLEKPFVDPNKTYFARFETSKGSFDIEFYSKVAPYTVSNFLNLARNGFYDGLKFHRVIEGFMAQGGDPNGTGSGGPGYKFDDEPNTQKNVRGAISMANAGPNTNGSQFFLLFQPAPHLDGKHTVFGKVIRGLEDVVDKINFTEGPHKKDPPDVMSRVTVYEK